MADYLPSDTVGWSYFVFGFVILFLFLWNRRERRRERTMEAAGQFRVWGIDDMADLLEAYTVGNYLGTGSIFRVIRRMILRARTEGIPSMFSKVADKILDYRLTLPEGRKEVAAKLTRAEAVAKLTPVVEDPTPSVD